MQYAYTPLGDRAIVIEAGTEISGDVQKHIRSICALLENHISVWMIEFVPAFTTVTVFYNPCFFLYEAVENELRELFQQTTSSNPPEARTIEIPVCYGGADGPDLEFVAKHNGLSTEEVISIHTNGSYTVQMIGFAPGFPYLSGMSEQIAAPRKETPRISIPARSVGIAGTQTGIYPISTPGGWQLIGSTPTRLFVPEEKIPSLLRAGDNIVFRQISAEEYKTLEEQENAYHS